MWPKLAAAVEGIDGYLAGGTALATRLQHRSSFDLDYMAHQEFSGADLFDRLSASASTAICTRAEPGRLFAAIDGVAVEVFAAPSRGEHPGHVQPLAPPSRLAGMRVASLPDLLAMKLDVIMYRPKVRDFIDLAAIDNHGQLTLEDGMALHMRRYGTHLQSSFLDRIVDRIEQPGTLPADPQVAAAGQRALAHLAGRVPQLRSHVKRMRKGVHGGGPPPARSGPAGLLHSEAATGGGAPPARSGPAGLVHAEAPAGASASPEAAPIIPGRQSAGGAICGRRTPTGPCRNPEPPRSRAVRGRPRALTA